MGGHVEKWWEACRGKNKKTEVERVVVAGKKSVQQSRKK